MATAPRAAAGRAFRPARQEAARLGAVVEGSAASWSRGRRSEFTHMSLDAEVRARWPSPRVDRRLARLRQLREARGYTGRNITVAVVDSGIDPATRASTDACVQRRLHGTGGGDQMGHGTHIIDLIAGADHGGNFGGVAPEARIVSLKVLKADGSGQTSDVIAALDGSAQPQPLPDPRRQHLARPPVFEPYQDDRSPGRAAPRRRGARRRGLGRQLRQGDVDGEAVPVFGGISSPGNLPDVITVARSTRRAPSRGRRFGGDVQLEGPTAFDKVLKPDLVAPAQGVRLHGGRHHRAGARFRPSTWRRRPTARRSCDERHERVAAWWRRGGADARRQPSLRHRHVKMALQLSAQFLRRACSWRLGSLNAAGAVWMAVNGPIRPCRTPSSATRRSRRAGALLDRHETGLREIVDGDRIIWATGSSGATASSG